MNRFYQFTKMTDDVTELFIFGDITSLKYVESDVTAFDFIEELNAVTTSKLNIRINSRGGEVDQGLAMYNAIKRFTGEVTTTCEGYAASIASVVFMAGSKRVMHKASLMLIHNAWTIVVGNSNDLKKVADDLDKMTQPSIDIYKSVSSLSIDEIKALMDEETWITADEALSYGFATEIIEIPMNVPVNQKSEFDSTYRLVTKVKSLEKQVKSFEKQLNPKTVSEADPWDVYFGKK